MQIVIDIPKDAYELLQTDGVDWLGAEHILGAVAKGKPLPEHHGRLIDADKTLTIAWHKFWNQEEEHEKTIEGCDILRDRFYEQEGFECCQQTIVNAETVIPATKEGE